MIIGIDPARPDSEATAIAYLIPNLLDQYSKTPLRPWLSDVKLPDTFIVPDPPWSPGGPDQAKSRLRRKDVAVNLGDVITTSKIIATKPAPKNPWHDLASMTALLDKRLDRLSMKAFQQQYLQDWAHAPMAQNFDRILRQRDPVRPDFVAAFLKAAERWSGSFAMDLLVHWTQAAEHDPQFIRDWIWGPNGEFTGFARINLMDGAERQFQREYPGPDGCEYQVRDVREVTFKLHLIRRRYRDDRGNSRYLYQDPMYRYDRELEDASYMRFATYEDYVRWDALAARDDYSAMETVRVERYR